MLSIQVFVDLLNTKIPNTKYLTYKLYVMLWLGQVMLGSDPINILGLVVKSS